MSWLLSVLSLLGCGPRDSEGVSSREPAFEARAQARAHEPLPPQVDNQHGPRVVFLGDSITAGLHLPAHQAYPAVLQRRLAEQGVAFRLLNAGVSGDTTSGGLRRVDWVLRQAPEIVVVELGGNDGLRGLTLSTIEQNLRAILIKVREKGARPLLLGMRIPGNYGADYARDFAAIYPRLAAELALPLVPYFMEGVAGVPELNLPDAIHPTAQGHERLAQNVLAPLRTLIAEVATAGAPGAGQPATAGP